MKKKNKEGFRKLIIIIGISLGILLIFLAVFNSDNLIFGYFNSLNSPLFIKASLFFSSLGEPFMYLIVFLLLIIISFVYKRDLLKTAIVFSASVISAAGISFILKEIIGRQRPLNIFEGGFSFPSGHSTVSMAGFGVLAFFLWPKNKLFSIALLSLPFLIALSRIILNMHWISDAAAGLLLGSIILLSFIYLEKKIGPLRRVQ